MKKISVNFLIVSTLAIFLMMLSVGHAATLRLNFNQAAKSYCNKSMNMNPEFCYEEKIQCIENYSRIKSFKKHSIPEIAVSEEQKALLIFNYCFLN